MRRTASKRDGAVVEKRDPPSTKAQSNRTERGTVNLSIKKRQVKS